jgi:hypothetical protein
MNVGERTVVKVTNECSPRHRIPHDSINERGSANVVDDAVGDISGRYPEFRVEGLGLRVLGFRV